MEKEGGKVNSFVVGRQRLAMTTATKVDARVFWYSCVARRLSWCKRYFKGYDTWVYVAHEREKILRTFLKIETKHN